MFMKFIAIIMFLIVLLAFFTKNKLIEQLSYSISIILGLFVTKTLIKKQN